MFNPEQERVNAIEHSASLSSAHYFMAIRRMVKEETDVDLLEKSPETLGLLVNAASREFHAGYIGLKLESLTSAINSLVNESPVSSHDVAALCEQISRSSGDILEGNTRLAKEIENLAADIEKKEV